MTSEERPTKIRRLSSSIAPIKSRTPSPSREHSDISVPHPQSPSSPTTSTPAQVQAPPDIPLLPSLPPGNTPNPLSKSQLKKQRKKAEWEALRPERKALRKQKDKEKKQKRQAEAREAMEARQGGNDSQSQPPNGEGEAGEGEGGDGKSGQHGVSAGTNPNANTNASSNHALNPKPPPKNTGIPVPLTILIDCSFNSLMMEKEIISLASQITRSYSETSRSRVRPNLVLTSWSGSLKERFDGVLGGFYKNWKGVEILEGEVGEVVKREGWKHGGSIPATVEGVVGRSSWQEVFGGGQDIPSSAPTPSQTEPPKGEIIYLTSDSAHTLTALSPHSTYIIGGLVDKNRYPRLCLQRAEAAGIKTARLPIDEYMKMQSRKVLTVNHVVEILLGWLEHGSWGRSLGKVVPKRKGGVLRGEGEGGGEGEEGVVVQRDSEDRGEGAAEGTEGTRNDLDDSPRVQDEEASAGGTESGVNGLDEAVGVSQPPSDPIV